MSSQRLAAFHTVIGFKNLNFVKHLMRHGLELDRMWRGEMPVSRAIYEEAYEILEYLVERGAEVNFRSQDHRMEPPLFAACRLGKLRAVRILLQSPNLDIDQRDFFNRTPLWAAVRFSSIEMVQLLLDRGADVTATEDSSECPFMLSLISLRRAPHSKIPYLLIKRGCFADFKNSYRTALYYAMLHEDRKLFCLLVHARCSVIDENWLVFDKLPLAWKRDEEFCQWIYSLHNNPRSLVQLTSCVIRKNLVKRYKNIFPSHISQLLLPEAVKECLLLEDSRLYNLC